MHTEITNLFHATFTELYIYDLQECTEGRHLGDGC